MQTTVKWEAFYLGHESRIFNFIIVLMVKERESTQNKCIKTIGKINENAYANCNKGVLFLFSGSEEKAA